MLMIISSSSERKGKHSIPIKLSQKCVNTFRYLLPRTGLMHGADGLKIRDSGTSKDSHRAETTVRKTRRAPPVRSLLVVTDCTCYSVLFPRMYWGSMVV